MIAEGSIQEVGTHKELVEEGGIYATLCEGQGLTADAGDDVEEEAALSPVSMSVSPTNIASITKSIHSSTREDVEKGLTNEDDKDDGPIDIKGVSSRIREYSKAEIGFTFLGCFGGMIVGVLPACEAILFGLITGNFFLIEDAQEMRDTNYALSLWFLVLAFASLGGNMAMGIGLGVSGSRLVSKMRVMVFDNLLRYPMGWFDFPEHSSGELTTILEEDSEAISNVTGFAQGLRIQVFSCLVAGMAVALGFSWQIGLIAIACIPLILGAGLLQAKCGKRETPDLNEVRSVSASTLLERAFHDIVVLQAYGLNDAVSSQYAAALAPDFESKKRQGFYNGLSFGFAQFAVFSTFAVIFYAGSEYTFFSRLFFLFNFYLISETHSVYFISKVELMLSMKVEFTDFFIALLAVMFSTFGAG